MTFLKFCNVNLVVSEIQTVSEIFLYDCPVTQKKQHAFVVELVGKSVIHSFESDQSARRAHDLFFVAIGGKL